MENEKRSSPTNSDEIEARLKLTEHEIETSLESLQPSDQLQVLINVLSKVNLETRYLILEALTMQSLTALDPKVEAAIDATIEDIHHNVRGASTDTLYERALLLFKKQGKEGVTLTSLEHIGMQIKEPYQDIAARKLVQRLRPKLQKHGVTIRHQRHSGKSLYDIIPQDNSLKRF